MCKYTESKWQAIEPGLDWSSRAREIGGGRARERESEIGNERDWDINRRKERENKKKGGRETERKSEGLGRKKEKAREWEELQRDG